MEVLASLFGVIFSIALFVGCILFLLIPSIIAHKRNHPSASLITVLNILIAWIPFVWIGLLIWAIFGGKRFDMPSVTIGQPSVQTINVEQRVDSPSTERVVEANVTTDHMGELAKVAALRQSGVLTEEEFATQKARILSKIT